jgi:tRNA (guanine37-N1)-methyltransferase
MIRYHILTIFPDIFDSYLNESILKRARENKKIKIEVYDIRKNSKDKHKKVDDKPYGGGPGMVMTALPIVDTVKKIESKINRRKNTKTKIIVFVPEQVSFNTAYAKKLVKEYTDIIMICGRYEGIDRRVTDILKAEEVSVGDFVLTGGELAAMIVLDSSARQIEGVLGRFESLEESRVSSHKVYTRPPEVKYKDKIYKVPEVLINGNHKEIDKWRENQ